MIRGWRIPNDKDMTVPRRKIVEWTLLLLAAGFSSLGFASVASSVSAHGGQWGASSLWFSLLAVCFLLAGVLYRERSMGVGFAVFSVGPSIFFAPTSMHLFLIVLSIPLMLTGLRKIDGDLRSRLSISFRRSMGSGVFLFVFPIASLIASQYYMEIRSDSWQDLVPRFSLAEGSGDFVLRAAGGISPEIARIRDERMTVDSFLSTVRGTSGYPGGDMDVFMDDMAAALSLEAGRAELGKLVGRDIDGDERMADVLSEALRNKMIVFLSGEKAERNLPNGALPFFLALLLFITILSIASLLRGVWILLATGLLHLFVYTNVLSVEKIPAEQEVLR